jgi:hypothetical protein
MAREEKRETVSAIVETNKLTSTADKPAQSTIVYVGVDRTDEQILTLNLDESILLDWVIDDFRKLPFKVVDQLSRNNLVRYITAEVKYESAKKEESSRVPKITRVSDPLAMHSAYRMQSLEPLNHIKAGWHLYWAAPGADIDSKKLGPYRNVRSLSDEQKAAVKANPNFVIEPGDENGSIIQLNDADGKPELILLEVREDLFQQHLEWQADESHRLLGGAKESLEGEIEKLNTGLPKKARMKVIDGN